MSNNFATNKDPVEFSLTMVKAVLKNLEKYNRDGLKLGPEIHDLRETIKALDALQSCGKSMVVDQIAVGTYKLTMLPDGTSNVLREDGHSETLDNSALITFLDQLFE